MPSFKFHAALELARVFVEAIVETCAGRGGGQAPAVVVPVPPSGTRRRERGYNRAWELVRRAARPLPCLADAHLLLRSRDTPRQLARPPDELAGMLRGAFAAEPRRRHKGRGRTIVIVDDAKTTGRTLAEIARVLNGAGAERVGVWVFARTPRPGDQ